MPKDSVQVVDIYIVRSASPSDS